MEFHSRKPTRIPGYDYSRENYYFVTICTHGKQCIFWTAGHLNMYGEIAKKDLQQIPEHFPNVRIDHYIVMPNHIHAIIVLDCENKTNLNNVVGLYKSGVSRKIRAVFPELKIWQRSFYDHIIRSQKEYENIWQYIEYNDQKWEEDCYFLETEETG